MHSTANTIATSRILLQLLVCLAAAVTALRPVPPNHVAANSNSRRAINYDVTTNSTLTFNHSAADTSSDSAFSLIRLAGPKTPITIPSAPTHQSTVNALLANISQAKQWAWLVRLTQFSDRYYKSENGRKSAEWIMSTVQDLAKDAVTGTKLSVRKFDHSWHMQPSIIARYESTSPNNLEGIIITGSHIDTLGQGGPGPEPHANPAADDCASGSSAVFEALRVMVESGFKPGRPIEFHWYSGEEEGLYGSKEVAKAYAKAGTKVVSYLNLDQSGYVKKGTQPAMGVVTDYTTDASTTLLKNVIQTYTTLGFVETECGYACTDNASWYQYGYEAALAAESELSLSSPYNDRVNSDGSPLDTLDTINATHVTEFAKSTLGFVVELSLAGSDQPPQPSATSVITATATATDPIPETTTSCDRMRIAAVTTVNGSLMMRRGGGGPC